MSSLNRPPFIVTTWMIPGRNNQTADFKDAPWLAEAGEITKDKVRIDQSEATLSEITTPSHGDLACWGLLGGGDWSASSPDKHLRQTPTPVTVTIMRQSRISEINLPKRYLGIVAARLFANSLLR